MRLSYTPISLLPFFLITFLTLFLKPDAKAQSMLAVNSSHHSSHDHSLVEVIGNEPIQSESISEKYSPEVVSRYPTAVNFMHSTITDLPIQNPHKLYTVYHPFRVRIYSTCIPNSMRITVKFFKVVIVPLWYARGSR
jgi:hypothetical protein